MPREQPSIRVISLVAQFTEFSQYQDSPVLRDQLFQYLPDLTLTPRDYLNSIVLGISIFSLPGLLSFEAHGKHASELR